MHIDGLTCKRTRPDIAGILKRPLITGGLLIAAAALLRLFFFSGFVLGDDPAYADYAARLLRGSYPAIGSHAVFACRPLLLLAIALPIRIFGWYEASFVASAAAASLVCTAVVFAAGTRLAGLRAGVLAGLLFAVFPLDAVHATTMSNDIILSALLWGGALPMLWLVRRSPGKRELLLSVLSGAVVGAGSAVKINAAAFGALVFCVVLLSSTAFRKARACMPAAGWLAGWLIVQGLLRLFFYLQCGDPFAQYHAEMRFNLDYNPSGFMHDSGHVRDALLFYPGLIAGFIQEGHTGHRFMPYGYMLLRVFRAMRIPAMLALGLLLIMQFAPLQLLPSYVPIHRLPRFLHSAAVPAAVALGVVLSRLSRNGMVTLRMLSWAALAFLVVTSLQAGYRKASFYRDCARDQRWAWSALEKQDVQRVVTDREMGNYLMFRSGFKPSYTLQSPPRLPRTIKPGAIVVAGGARRPDMFPGYAAAWARGRADDLEVVAEAPFPRRPWRPSPLRLYRAAFQP